MNDYPSPLDKRVNAILHRLNNAKPDQWVALSYEECKLLLAEHDAITLAYSHLRDLQLRDLHPTT